MSSDCNQINKTARRQETSCRAVLTVSHHDLACSHSLLRQRSLEVVDIGSPNTAAIYKTLCESFYSIPYAKGLSAIQLGIPLQVALVNLSRLPSGELLFINPTDIKISGRMVKRSEGCLCLPDYKANIARRNKVSFKASNLEGKTFTYSAVGYEAAVIQHELDHMIGRLYWDYLSAGVQPDKIVR